MAFTPARRFLENLSGPLRKVLARLAGPQVAAVGATPRWVFRKAILQGGRVRRLADLRGRALLIQFIGLG